MRISVIEDDPGFTLDRKYSVMLDGVLVKHVITADSELGFVDVYKTDSEDNFVLNEQRGDLVIETKHGRVKFVNMLYKPPENHRDG